jgi:hypothetical protein
MAISSHFRLPLRAQIVTEEVYVPIVKLGLQLLLYSLSIGLIPLMLLMVTYKACIFRHKDRKLCHPALQI